MNWLGILATVLAPGGLLALLIEKTRRENNRDHDRNSKMLKSIDTKVDKIDQRLDHHIEWHLDKE
ncbi:MAG: hypothetical protein EB075_11030 [Bacteroidetes bacterium]|nr:hypothetical protein [Bacteroidota bacterium]